MTQFRKQILFFVKKMTYFHGFEADGIFPNAFLTLRHKMPKSPIVRLPAILLDFANHPSGETDCIYEANVK